MALSSFTKSSPSSSMALKEYGKETLNANWFEERSESLAGVLPDDGTRQFTTTSGTDYKQEDAVPSKLSWAQRQQKVNKKKAMIQVDNFNMINANRNTGRPLKGYGALLPSGNPNAEAEIISNFSTSNQKDFGVGVKVTRTEQAKIKLGNVPASGGCGSTRPEKGFATSGACGEVYKQSADPQKSTKAQRSWMYSEDPMIKVKEGQKAPATTSTVSPTSSSSPPVSFGRKASVITGNAKHKEGIFADVE